ncbi:MAG: hypothetical protein AAGI07_00995 [Bacteroidota bacterium]
MRRLCSVCKKGELVTIATFDEKRPPLFPSSIDWKQLFDGNLNGSWS